jgi:NAD(P)H-hydrate epimerase
MKYTAITVADMVEVDRLMVEEYGIALPQMMENAGRSLAVIGRRLLGGNAAGHEVLVLAGKGNNGGGGLVAARHLANAGARVTIALNASPSELGDVPRLQHATLAKMGVSGTGRITRVDELKPLLQRADLVIDALIGYSLHGAPREAVASVIRAANISDVTILALDIPSGLDGDSGVPYDPCIRSDATLTLAWPKAGLLSPHAQEYVGALYLADISVPVAVYRAVGVEPGTLFAKSPIVSIRLGAYRIGSHHALFSQLRPIGC